MIEKLAHHALDLLAKVEPFNIYAGRKGQVAAVKETKGTYLAFRRLQDGIRLERWPPRGQDNGKPRYFGMVPEHLVPTIQAVLDSIP